MTDGRKVPWLPGAATALAILSGYGTTVLISLLSLLGISLAIDERAWAGAIGVFAALATLGIAASYRRHRLIGPTVVAAFGLALILWAMYGSYSRVIELAGFVLLIAATLWDWRAGGSPSAAVDDGAWIESGSLADRLGRDAKPVIVDVRGPDEFSGPLGHIAAARNLPVGELTSRLCEIDTLRDKPIVLVCRTDKRSATASALLRNTGFRDVRVLRGGMERWNDERRPVADRLPQSEP